MKLPAINKEWTLFLDRDGVINKRIPGAYVRHWEEFEFMPGAVEAIVAFSHYFGRICVVTNQQGIGKGLMSEDDLAKVHQKMCAVIKEAGGQIDRVYFSPKLAKDNPFCRKPAPGMAYQALKDFPEITMSKSVLVGDSISDIVFGNNLGMITILVTSNEETSETLQNNKLANLVKIDVSVEGLFELAGLLASSK